MKSTKTSDDKKEEDEEEDKEEDKEEETESTSEIDAKEKQSIYNSYFRIFNMMNKEMVLIIILINFLALYKIFLIKILFSIFLVFFNI